MKIPNYESDSGGEVVSLARIVSEDSQRMVPIASVRFKSSKDS